MQSLRPFLSPFLFTLLTTALCAVTLKISLGTFFAPFFLAAITTPTFARDSKSIIRSSMITIALTLGPIFVLTILTFFSALTFKMSVPVFLVLLTFNLLLAHLTRLFKFSSLTSAITLVFLAWPVWLPPHLSNDSKWIDKLVNLHPLLTINAPLQDLGIWSQLPIAYQITSLGQDIPYSFPSILTHISLILALTVLAIVLTLARNFAVSRIRPYNPQFANSAQEK